MAANELRREGGCLCGAIRYTVTGAPLLSAVCHCRHCQRQGGSAFSVVCAVAASQYEQRGETRVFQDRGDSGQAVHRHFCDKCGSPIVSIADVLPDLTIVKAGTFDDPCFIVPTQEAYCRDAWAFVPPFSGTERFFGTNIGESR